MPVARADAALLPFPGNAFGAVIAAHLFHLVPEWRDASLEVLWVLRPTASCCGPVAARTWAAVEGIDLDAPRRLGRPVRFCRSGAIRR